MSCKPEALTACSDDCAAHGRAAVRKCEAGGLTPRQWLFYAPCMNEHNDSEGTSPVSEAPAGSGYFGPESAVSGGESDAQAQSLNMLAPVALAGVFVSIVLGCGGLVGTLLGYPVGWAVFSGPVVGLVSSAAAFIALRQILTSGGRLMGRFPALLALFVGLGITTLTGFTALAALLVASASKNLAPIVADVAIGAQQGWQTQALDDLSTAAKEDVDADRLAMFGSLLQRELGTVTGANAGFDIVVGSRNVIAESPGAQFVTQAELAELPRPVWLEFDRADGSSDRVIAYVAFDLFDREAELRDAEARSSEQQPTTDDDAESIDEEGDLAPGDGGEGGVRSFRDAREAAVIVSDIAVVVGPNRVVLLREAGPLSELSEKMGWEVVVE